MSGMLSKKESMVAQTANKSSEFQPDVVQTITDASIAAEHGAARGRIRRELPADIKALRLQIRAIQIMAGLTGWLRSSGGVYLISSVVDGIGPDPITFQGKTYQDIRDGDLLPLGPTEDPSAVFNVYLREGELPRALSFCLLVVRSNQDLRDLGTTLSQVMADEHYSKLVDIATTAVTGIAPAYGVLAQAAQESIALIAGYLKVKPDDQLGYYQANYTNRFDNLGVGKHPPEMPTIEVGKVRLGYQIDAA
jgi:hypothetical protein